VSYRRASYAMFSASVPWTSTRTGARTRAFDSNDGCLVSRATAERNQAGLAVTARVIIRTSGCGGVLQLFDEDDCSVVVSTELQYLHQHCPLPLPVL
jgi:hypothetical protein